MKSSILVTARGGKETLGCLQPFNRQCKYQLDIWRLSIHNYALFKHIYIKENNGI